MSSRVHLEAAIGAVFFVDGCDRSVGWDEEERKGGSTDSKVALAMETDSVGLNGAGDEICDRSENITN